MRALREGVDTGTDDVTTTCAKTAATPAAGSLPINPPPTFVSSQSVSDRGGKATTRTAQPLEGATVVAGVAAALSGDGEQFASPLEQLLVGLGAAADVTGVLVLAGTGVP